MSVVLGLHLQSDRVLAAVGPDGSAGESRQVFPASLRWPADTAPTLPHRRNHDAIYRHFVDHIGDPRPLSIPGAPDRLADDLAATLISTVVAAVESSRHEHVSRVLIAHPTYWTVAQLSSFHTSLVGAGLGENRALLLAPDIDVALGWIDHTTGLVGAQQVSVCDLRAESAIVGHARRPRSGHLTAVTAHGYPGLGVSRLDERLGRRVLARATHNGPPASRHPALLARVRTDCAEARTTMRTTSLRIDVEAPSTRQIKKHDVTLHSDDIFQLARSPLRRDRARPPTLHRARHNTRPRPPDRFRAHLPTAGRRRGHTFRLPGDHARRSRFRLRARGCITRRGRAQSGSATGGFASVTRRSDWFSARSHCGPLTGDDYLDRSSPSAVGSRLIRSRSGHGWVHSYQCCRDIVLGPR